MGAKGKYTPEIVTKIASIIEGGNFARTACLISDISEETYYKWLREKTDFSEAIKKAEAVRESNLLVSIKKDTSWQSKAWMLERLSRPNFHLPTITDNELSERIVELEKLLHEAVQAKQAPPVTRETDRVISDYQTL